MVRQEDLFDVVDVDGGLSLVLGAAQRRQKHAGQNRDNGDHYQQFNQGKRPENLAVASADRRFEKINLLHTCSMFVHAGVRQLFELIAES